MFYADELTNTKNTTTVIINSAPDVPHAMLFPYLPAYIPTSFSSLPSPSPFCRYLPISIPHSHPPAPGPHHMLSPYKYVNWCASLVFVAYIIDTSYNNYTR